MVSDVTEGRTANNAGVPRSEKGRLARSVGMAVVALSILSQEFGTGINYLVPQGLGKYPGVQNLIPLAIFVAGICFIPQVVLYCRYARVLPHAGSVYVWLTRSLGPMAGFIASFIWFAGLCGSTGFVAYTCATFVGSTLDALGLASAWTTTPAGHLLVGLLTIWSLAGLHCTGIRQYGRFLWVVSACIVAAVTIVVFTGFTTDPGQAAEILGHATGNAFSARTPEPSATSFLSVVALFIFAYGGLSGGASLGGEAVDPRKAVPRGIIMGWSMALVSYTLIALALFHAVPWWVSLQVLESGQGELLTAPSLIGLLTYRPVAVFLNALTSIIIIKTVAPQLLCLSRFLYAWSEDGFVPRSLQVTNRMHVPARAIVLSGLLVSAFLTQLVFSGWSIGVAVRALSMMVTSVMLGVGILVSARLLRGPNPRPFSMDLAEGHAIRIMAVVAIVVGSSLIALVSYQPGTAWYFQPWFQALVFIAIAFTLVTAAIRRHAGAAAEDFRRRFREAPE